MSRRLRSFLIRSTVSVMKNRNSRRIVAAEVRVALARQGGTQADLATKAGLSKASLSRKMRGDVAFTVDELVAVAIALDVDAGSLIAPALATASAA